MRRNSSQKKAPPNSKTTSIKMLKPFLVSLLLLISPVGGPGILLVGSNICNYGMRRGLECPSFITSIVYSERNKNLSLAAGWLALAFGLGFAWIMISSLLVVATPIYLLLLLVECLRIQSKKNRVKW